MFHPVGSQPPSVYWRRRLAVLAMVALVLVLVVLTVRIAASGGGGQAQAGTPTPTPTSTAPPSSPSSSPTSSPATPARSSATGTSASVSQPPAPVACAAKDLAVQAVVGQQAYSVGDKPLLQLQVTNTGAAPCVQDLADKQVELRVYNGESRVWGSHDCQVQPGTALRTLAVNSPVQVAITWSGLTSQPGCQGTRQRVGAGTYTLYALLSGRTGKAAQFTIR